MVRGDSKEERSGATIACSDPDSGLSGEDTVTRDHTRLPTLLTAYIAIALLLGCAPTSQPSAGPSMASSRVGNAADPRSPITLGASTWTATVNAVRMSYEVVEVFTAEGGSEREPRNDHLRREVRDRVCHMQVNRAVVPTTRGDLHDLAIYVAMETAMCFDAILFDGDHNGWQSSEAFAAVWTASYLEACGPILAPLGWPVEDGDCVIPVPWDVSPWRVRD